MNMQKKISIKGEITKKVIKQEVSFLYATHCHDMFYIQSTLVISKSKGPSETLRDIRTLTYQICRIEENTNPTTKFYK